MVSLVTLALISSVHAATPSAPQPAWQWSAGQERTWYIESRTTLPTVLDLLGRKSIDAHAADIELRTLVRCQPESGARLDQKTVPLTCVIDDIALAAGAFDGEADKLQAILEEDDTLLTGATLQLRLGRDGHLGLVDLEGVPKSDARMSEIEEQLRLLLLRAMSGLDMSLPEGADRKGWTQHGTRIAEYPSNAGTQSFSSLDNTALPAGTGQLRVHGEGRTSLRVMQTNDHGEAQDYIVTGGLGSEALFDTSSGALVERCWYLNASPTASATDYQASFAVNLEGRFAWQAYAVAGDLLLVSSDMARPDVGETGVDRFVSPGPREAAERWQAKNEGRVTAQR